MVLEDSDLALIPRIVYHPQTTENQISKFTKFVEDKYNIKLGDYWKLHEWSCKNYPEFWDCMWKFFGIVHSKPYTEVFDLRRSFENMKWFKGVRFNYAENIFKHRDSRTALITIDPADNVEHITYKDMYYEVCLYAAALKALGVKKGDVVAGYMPNKKEAVFAFLATASMGALWSGSMHILGVKAVLTRFQQVCPVVLFTAGNFCFEGKEINMIEKLKQIIPGLPTLKKVIFVPSKIPGAIQNIECIPKCCTIAEFLNAVQKEFHNNPWELEFEQVPFNYPLNIGFTSGTTNLPKGMIHSHGVFFASLRDFGLQQNITREDVMLNFSATGWIAWNMFVNSLHLGMTLCLYEGNPFTESPTRFWDLVDRFKITSLYTWTCLVEAIEKNGYLPTEDHSLKSLRQIFPIGSPLKPHSYDFLTGINPGMIVDSGYGTSELFGMIAGIDSTMPIYRGEIQCFALGMNVKCLDDKGNEVTGKRGNLVLANPYPAMPTTLLNDNSKDIMRESYLIQYPGYWNVADEAWINPVTKGFIVFGRTDDNLNPRGARFNCNEIYFALEDVPEIFDSVCVSQFNKLQDERAVLFVKMKPGISLTESIENEIRSVIEKNFSLLYIPDIIMQVPDIPYNLTGKKMNVLVKKLINKIPVINADFVMNPSSLDFYRKVDLGHF